MAKFLPPATVNDFIMFMLSGMWTKMFLISALTLVLSINPQGEISLPHSRAILGKLKNEDKDLFLLEIVRNDVKKHKMQLFPFRFHLT